ncbi:MAG TPA: sensor histidine kinase [Streptomyces sp.]
MAVVNRDPRTAPHGTRNDAILAAVLAAAGVALALFTAPHDRPDALGWTLLLAAYMPIVWRRRHPLLALAAVVALVAPYHALDNNHGAPVPATCVALYTVAVTGRPLRTVLTAVAVLGVTVAAMFAVDYHQGLELLRVSGWVIATLFCGVDVRYYRQYVAAIVERAERAERTREEEARRRVAEERLRIARDLHDVVAHHIALVNVQAGVAAHVMDKRPDQAKEALAHVREASRSALNELRATVGLLRQSGDPEAPTEPAPGLDRLDELVGTFRRAGLQVEVARADHGTTLPAAVGLAAYRVIQEALTNVQKHAGTEAKAEVSVVRVGPNVEVTVLDNGPGHDPEQEPEDGGGHGLLGMRERVTALGGSCTAAPRYGGGFRVHAILPVKNRAPALGD